MAHSQNLNFPLFLYFFLTQKNKENYLLYFLFIIYLQVFWYSIRVSFCMIIGLSYIIQCNGERKRYVYGKWLLNVAGFDYETKERGKEKHHNHWEGQKKNTQQRNISTQVLKFQKETNVLAARGLTVVWSLFVLLCRFPINLDGFI